MKYWALYVDGNLDPIEIIPSEVKPTDKNFKLACGYRQVVKYFIYQVEIKPLGLPTSCQ